MLGLLAWALACDQNNSLGLLVIIPWAHFTYCRTLTVFNVITLMTLSGLVTLDRHFAMADHDDAIVAVAAALNRLAMNMDSNKA